jgi:hypothetical protein
MIVFALVLSVAASAFSLEKQTYQMKEDFGAESVYDGALQYYYYIPCPTNSYFWAFSGFDRGDIISVQFNIGEQGTGGWEPVDALNCHTVETIRVLDFAGYGTIYPGLFTVEFDLYCAGYSGPTFRLWNSGPVETGYGWNYINAHVFVTSCMAGPPEVPFVITATHTGSDGMFPAWGMDDISTPVRTGCALHDIGCLPALYPRIAVHSGYVGTFPFEYWPPLWFCDGRDTTPDCTLFGPLELAWRIDISCYGPNAAEPTTWGTIKSLYR